MHYASMVFNGRAYKLVRKKKLPKMKLVAIVRAKNSILVLEESMKKLSSLVDEIIVLDNGSTDGTLEMCEKFPKIVKIIRRDDTNNFHEGRDRNLMLEEARKRYPDWITLADPDEVFEKHLSRDIIDKYMHSGHDRIAFRMCNFWLSRKYCRFDRDWFLYTLQPQRQMWRNLEGIHFEDIQIHAWLKGIDSKIYTSPFRIKHYGYINKKNVDAKMTVFKQADPAHPEKYKSSDLEHKESTENILWYPFIEPNNKIANYVYIIFFKLLCDFLLILVKTKRKYFRKLRIFSN
jgi:glycosyltransferase involved in cell wall biosynthesis